MKASARSAIRSDILADYEPPSPDLVLRVLGGIPSRPKHRDSHRGRVALQTAAVLLITLVIGATTIGVRVARGELALPAGLPLGVGGLHPPAASYFIVDAEYISADTAWILAQLHVHNGPIVLMKTTDGGKTWHEQFRIPDDSTIGSFHVWNVNDGDLIELVPSTLPPTKTPGAPGSSNMVPRTYRTHDGGAHWSLVDVPIDWSSPPGGPDFFLTQLEAWRISGRGLRQTPMTLQHTTDGGVHWTTAGTTPAGASLNSTLTFTDRQTGWLTADRSKSYAWGANGKPITSTPPTALLWVTRDGGQTWAPIDLPLPDEAAANNVGLASPFFFGSRDGLLEFSVSGPPPTFSPQRPTQAPPQGWTHSYILTTHDGGHHWANLIQMPAGVGQGLFFDARHWLMAAGPALAETYDGGKTWTTRQVLANGLEFGLAPWNHIDGKAIWSQVGPDRLLRSTDGGAHWTAVTPPSIK